MCVRRSIAMVAVTEHDEICRVDPAPFTVAGVMLVPGCEFTTDRGAHVIGLFVRSGIPKGMTREAVFAHIRSEGGLIVLPHPFKPGSGYFDFYEEDAALDQVAFAEMLNGGWDSSGHVHRIREICARHGIRMIASSDSHRVAHVGLCVTRVLAEPAEAWDDPVRFLSGLGQERIELLFDEAGLRKEGRKIRAFQHTGAYQRLLSWVPKSWRRRVKLWDYRLRRPDLLPAPTYRHFPM